MYICIERFIVMRHTANKSNISILKDYVAGIRPFTQIGYTGNVNKHHKEGDRWTDTKGIEWERKGGKNIRLTKTQGDMIRKMISQKCKCGQEIKFGSRLDRIFFAKTGLCENCLIDYETKLRIIKAYPDYEKYKLISNEIGFLRDIKQKLKETIEFFINDNGDINVLCNDEGFIETFKNTNRDKVLKDAKNDLKLCRRRITALIKERDIAKALYVAKAKEYKLEIYGR